MFSFCLSHFPSLFPMNLSPCSSHQTSPFSSDCRPSCSSSSPPRIPVYTCSFYFSSISCKVSNFGAPLPWSAAARSWTPLYREPWRSRTWSMVLISHISFRQYFTFQVPVRNAIYNCVNTSHDSIFCGFLFSKYPQLSTLKQPIPESSRFDVAHRSGAPLGFGRYVCSSAIF